MEKCVYQYQLDTIKGCKLNGALCEFPADIQRCPIVRDKIRVCADLLTVLTPFQAKEIQQRQAVITLDRK